MIPGAEAFRDDLEDVLPADLPNRERLVRGCAEHFALIAEANRHFNLTRITSPRDAAIKHALDSVLPHTLFRGVRRVLDAGTGAGFPGIPLALALPDVRFTLAESILKKARFVESAVSSIELPNARVEPRRAEDLWKSGEYDIVTMRAVAPIARILDLAGTALKRGTRLLLYKGPDVEQEIAEALRSRRGMSPNIRILMTYELPASAGSRNVVEITA